MSTENTSSSAPIETTPSAEETAVSAAPTVETPVVQATDSPAPTPAQVAEAKRIFKLKVNGKEYERDEETLQKEWQLREASDQKFREAAELRAATEKREEEIKEVIKMLKENPKAALTHKAIGVDLRKFAEDVLAEALEEELMDPREKAIRDRERALEAKEAIEAQKVAKQAQLEQQAVAEAQFEKMKALVQQTIDKTGLPKNNTTFKRIVSYLQATEHRGELPSADELAMAVVEEDKSYFNVAVKEMTPEQLAGFLGEDRLKVLREWDLKRLKQPAQSAKPQEQPKASPKKPAKKSLTWAELRREIEANLPKK